MKNCEYCGNALIQKEKEKDRHFKIRRFCNQSCSSSFQHISKGTKLSLSSCCKCGIQFQPVNNKLKHCVDCISLNKHKTAPKKNRLDRNTTKDNLFSTRKNWQSARSQIRKDAARIFFEVNNEPTCLVCGYDKHVEVCHIISVADFPGDATISEINALENLVGLCPNHHWEFDNNLVELIIY
jgi:hypothetical protein